MSLIAQEPKDALDTLEFFMSIPSHKALNTREWAGVDELCNPTLTQPTLLDDGEIEDSNIIQLSDIEDYNRGNDPGVSVEMLFELDKDRIHDSVVNDKCKKY